MSLGQGQERNSNWLNVVIPTLDAAATLPSTLAALRGARVVIVDGGSVDGTVAIAEAAGASVLQAPRGRGAQFAAGIAATRAPWLLLLHADTRLASGWRGVVAEMMAQSDERAGYFRFALDSHDLRARLLERAVAMRCRVLRLPYGDQALLISRRLLAARGGMRPIPLMEDVDLACRLRPHLIPLKCDAITSAERWEHDGWVRRSARNLACLALWYAGLSPGRIARLYR